MLSLAYSRVLKKKSHSLQIPVNETNTGIEPY